MLRVLIVVNTSLFYDAIQSTRYEDDTQRRKFFALRNFNLRSKCRLVLIRQAQKARAER